MLMNENIKTSVSDFITIKDGESVIINKNGNIEKSKPFMKGHLTITDKNTNEVLLDKDNAIHFENMSIALANSLTNRPEGNIHEIHFGNGGSVVSGTGAITYFPPNTTNINADLYNPTYFKVVNDQSALNTDTANNYIEVRHVVNTTYTDIVITATLDYSEPAGQQAFDNSATTEGTFVFDEIGIKTFDTIPGNGNLITHVIFNPIQKSLNRLIEIVYTIRISL
jgi:hypothetical protein